MIQTEITVIRFGLGARPGEFAAAAADPRAWLLKQLQGPVKLASNVALAPSDRIFTELAAAREQRREMKQETAADGGTAASNPVRDAYLPHYRAQVLARAQSAAQTTRPFAERLVHFWTNHFAVSADKGAVIGVAGTFENEAVRPHVNGRFVDLLMAAEQHPAMIEFLDNQNSVGKDSELAQAAARRAAAMSWGRMDPAAKPRREFGINENLGREILELHTLGVHGGYTQGDVTAFAQILTGWSIGGGKGRLAGGVPGRFYFRDTLHEPGPRTFMGRTYRQSGVRQGAAVLADLAAHPSTARFIATKLVRHFIADDPPSSAVERVTQAFLKSGGDLPRVYAALIECPQSWDADMRKYKTPQDFVFSTLRALDAVPRDPQEMIRTFDLLGQRQFTPGSPAGWPDTAKGWDGSDALMHRVLWASRMAARFERGQQPTDVAAASLGGYVRPGTTAALRRASSPAQALALLLMSPEFQRR
ncbi:MAG TPA: DUF1800 domain-containing protein [Steroidobacteraceae bacterium]|nr:DUF1800 domain-containing protein [Steroidobacteraceae bacterium]